MSLPDYFRKRKIERRVRNMKTTPECKPWERVENVMLVFESNPDEQNDDIRQLMQELTEEGKSVSACMYVDVKVSPTMSRDNFVVIDHKGVGFLGAYKCESATRVVANERFDVVIDLTTHLIYPLMHFVIDVNAAMRCGQAKDEMTISPYDMQMEMEAVEREEIFKQIMKYLKMIK